MNNINTLECNTTFCSMYSVTCTSATLNFFCSQLQRNKGMILDL